MEAVAAIGVASSIITFIDAGSKILRTAKEVHNSLDGAADETLTRETVAKSMRDLSGKLQTPAVQQRPGLCDLTRECHRLAGSILEASEATKAKERGSKRGALGTAWKLFRNKSTLADLDDRLEKCKTQLGLEILHLMNQENAQQLAQLLSQLKEDASRVVQVENTVKQLRRGVQVDCLSSEVLLQIRQMLYVQEEALHKVYEDRILRSLRFETMDARRDQIHDPQGRTFSWILDWEDEQTSSSQIEKSSENEEDGEIDSKERDDRDEDYADEGEDRDQEDEEADDRDKDYEYGKQMTPEMRDCRQRFVWWLSAEAGIFHISGKLGSGKSTLMRFLYSHTRTQRELEKWAGEKKLVQASFFFWRPGSSLQNTLPGLYRSILYDILKACPELIPKALPRFWDLAKSSSAQTQSFIYFSTTDIDVALISLLQSQNLYAKNRLCLFIDGLDEYAESAIADYRTLVDLLNNWTRLSNGGLKICVSSREENAFMNGFYEDQRMRLHQLTWLDMTRYTRELLEHVGDEEVLSDLSSQIPQKADGIFLWTTLVVRAIRKEMEAGSTHETLVKVLEQLPRGLEGLFKSILNSLEKRHRLRLFQTIALLKISSTEKGHTPLLLLAYSFLDAYELDPDFATKPDFDHEESTKGDDLDTRSARAEAQVRNICGGLIETLDSGVDAEIPTSYLQFTHRSIPDIFSEDQFAIDMASALANFDAVGAISQIHLAAARLIHTKTIKAEVIWNMLAWFLFSHFDHKSFKLLQFIDSWSRPMDVHTIDEPTDVQIPYRWMGWYLVGRIMTKSGKGSGRNVDVFSVLYIAAIFGNVEFCRWKLQTGPNACTSVLDRSIVAHCLIYYGLHNDTEVNAICDLLSDRLFFDDQTALEFIPPTGAVKLGVGDGLTIGQQTLVSFSASWCDGRNSWLDKTVGRTTLLDSLLKLGISNGFYFIREGGKSESGSTVFHFDETEIRYSGEAKVSDGRYTIRDVIQSLETPAASRLLALINQEQAAVERQGRAGVDETTPDPEHLPSLDSDTNAKPVSSSVSTKARLAKMLIDVFSARITLFIILGLLTSWALSMWRRYDFMSYLVWDFEDPVAPKDYHSVRELQDDINESITVNYKGFHADFWTDPLYVCFGDVHESNFLIDDHADPESILTIIDFEHTSFLPLSFMWKLCYRMDDTAYHPCEDYQFYHCLIAGIGAALPQSPTNQDNIQALNRLLRICEQSN